MCGWKFSFNNVLDKHGHNLPPAPSNEWHMHMFANQTCVGVKLWIVQTRIQTKKKVEEPRRTICPYANVIRTVFSGSALCFQASQQEEKWRRWLTEYNESNAQAALHWCYDVKLGFKNFSPSCKSSAFNKNIKKKQLSREQLNGKPIVQSFRCGRSIPRGSYSHVNVDCNSPILLLLISTKSAVVVSPFWCGLLRSWNQWVPREIQ